MESLTRETIITSRNLIYTYYTSNLKTPRPIVLCIHGWPDTAALWSDFITNHLLQHNYGVIALDCLGYGGSSKPRDPGYYILRDMAEDVIEILNKEGVGKVIALGHDWGVPLGQRVYNYHPERVKGLVTVGFPYHPGPGLPFDLDSTLQKSIERFGYGLYWHFKLLSANDGAEILNTHIESLWTICHARDPKLWLSTFCKEDGLQNFLLEDKRVPVQRHADGPFKDAFLTRMRTDGFESSLMWYKALIAGLYSNMDLPKERYVVVVSYLHVAMGLDVVTSPNLLGGGRLSPPTSLPRNQTPVTRQQSECNKPTGEFWPHHTNLAWR